MPKQGRTSRQWKRFPIRPVLEHYGGVVPGGKGRPKMKCPFHDDRVASAQINLDKQTFYCYAGCGGGSAIDIIMMREGYSSYGPAAEFAERITGESGTELPQESPPGPGLFD